MAGYVPKKETRNFKAKIIGKVEEIKEVQKPSWTDTIATVLINDQKIFVNIKGQNILKKKDALVGKEVALTVNVSTSPEGKFTNYVLFDKFNEQAKPTVEILSKPDKHKFVGYGQAKVIEQDDAWIFLEVSKNGKKVAVIRHDLTEPLKDNIISFFANLKDFEGEDFKKLSLSSHKVLFTDTPSDEENLGF